MYTRLALIFLLLGLVAGCSRQAASPVQPAPASVLQVAPTDGSAAVRLDAGVILDFGVAVDRNAVESGFHLVSESDMTASCPDSTMAAHGSMDAVMADPGMLAHMDAFHSTPGGFSWNDAGTICTFMPDSLMRPQTRYMMHMGRPMLDMMNGMGGKMPAGQMTGSGDMVSHFQTTTADGHAGHH